MRAFETLDQLTTPDGKRLTLHRRDGDFFIYLDGEELMSSRAPGSEVALAELALAEWAAGGSAPRAGRPQRGSRSARPAASAAGPRLLIGGLGLGYTLRAALDGLPPGGRVVVAEVFAPVVAWNRGPLAPLHRRALDDPRVRVVETDVAELLAPPRRWDIVLLDVDNGPGAWCLAANGRLYDRRGLARLREVLAPDGVVAVWSAQRDDRFLKSLERAGFRAHARTVRAHGGKGGRHTIFLARASRAVRRGAAAALPLRPRRR